ncbi:Xyloglucan endotransglucosylase/hydrolase 2 [Bienertia sinuspersici]
MGILSIGHYDNVLVLKVAMMVVAMVSSTAYGAGNFHNEFESTFGGERVRISGPSSEQLSLSLDQSSGSGFRSKKEYMFGRIDMQMKFVAVTLLVLLLLYICHRIKVFGRRTPLRVFRNYENKGISFFPKHQPQRIYASLWEADDWATQGGAVKTDWSKAPFTAYYRNFNIDNSPNGKWRTHDLDANSRKRMKWVQKNYMIYDYCTDWKRFSQAFPPECKHSKAE